MGYTLFGGKLKVVGREKIVFGTDVFRKKSPDILPVCPEPFKLGGGGLRGCFDGPSDKISGKRKKEKQRLSPYC